jgi:transposase-like protein
MQNEQNENEIEKKNRIDYEGRKIRGYAIISKGDSPEHIGRGVYRIPSQSGNGVYIVSHHNPNHWACNCQDYLTRRINCKHIYAIKFWLTLKKKIEEKEELEITIPKHANRCTFCFSDKIVKFGKVRSSGKQRYRCQNCGKTSVGENEFKKYKGSPKIITAVMDLYFKGCSLRKIQDHIKQFYSLEITHVTIYYWIKRFTKLMNNYVDTLQPQVSGMWHTDEQMVRIKKKDSWAYCWNVIDAETRFLLANNITEGRSVAEARQVFRKAKDVRKKPDVVVTDGLQAYNRAITREFKGGFTKTEHIRNAGIAKSNNNNKVERFHNTFRERDKTIRGFQNNNTAQNWANGFRLYYNYIRPHSKFNGLTPSEVAGIKIQNSGNRWEGLLRLSMKNSIGESPAKE